MTKRSYWKGIFGFAKAGFLRFFRDKTALFFTFLFPLIFLFIFGSIFNNKTFSLKIALINHSETQFAKQFVEEAKKDKNGPIKIQDIHDMETAKNQMKRSQIDGIVELPADFGKVAGEGQQAKVTGTLKVLYSKGSDQSGSFLQAMFEQTVAYINRGMGHPDAPLKVTKEAVGDAALSNFDYTFTGLVAFSLMSMGVFGLANMLPGEKQNGQLRRLRAAPFTAGQLLIAYTLVYTSIAIVSMTSMMIVGLVAFKFNMRGSWLLFSLIAVLGAVLMTGIGLAIGGWAQNENQSSPVSNLVSMPMMFLSGTFFPSFFFPGWLQAVTGFLPLTPITNSMRLIMTENAGLIEILPQLGAIGAWILLIYIIAVKIFRWE